MRHFSPASYGRCLACCPSELHAHVLSRGGAVGIIRVYTTAASSTGLRWPNKTPVQSGGKILQATFHVKSLTFPFVISLCMHGTLRNDGVWNNHDSQHWLMGAIQEAGYHWRRRVRQDKSPQRLHIGLFSDGETYPRL